MTDASEVWVSCPTCTRRLLLARIDIPVTIAAGQMWADLSEVSAALELHVRTCPA